MSVGTRCDALSRTRPLLKLPVRQPGPDTPTHRRVREHYGLSVLFNAHGDEVAVGGELTVREEISEASNVRCLEMTTIYYDDVVPAWAVASHSTSFGTRA